MLTNTGAGRAFRAPQHPPGSFGMESIMDMLAYKLGIDPLEFQVEERPERHPSTAISPRCGTLRMEGKVPSARQRVRLTVRLKRGVGLASASWGSGGSGSKAECNHPCRRQRGGALRHAGSRDRLAHAGGDGRGGDVRIASPTRSPRASATRLMPAERRQRRQHDEPERRPGGARSVRQRARSALNARVGQEGTWAERWPPARDGLHRASTWRNGSRA